MPVFSAIATLGTAAVAALGTTATTLATGASVVGTIASGVGAYTQYQGSKQVSAASRRAEMVRKAQMEAESRRKQMEIFRQAALQRSRAISSAVARGIDTGTQGSTLGGSLGGIASQAGNNVLANSENLAFGRQLFGLNADIAEGQGRAALGGAYSDFGKTLFANSQAIGRVGSTLFTGNNTIGEWETV